MPLRKVSKCHQEFEKLIYKLAEICNMQLTSYVVEFGCEDVDSFLTGIYKVRLRGTRDGQKIRKVVLMKWHPEPKMRSCFRESYKREFIFYQHIMPKLLNVQRSFKNIEGLKIKFPNCILASVEYDKESIAVLGLQKDGFRLRNRLFKADLDHVSLVMKNLAKLHALGFVLQTNNPREFEDISSLCSEDVQYSNPGSTPKSMRSYYESSVNVVFDTAARDQLKELAPHILTVLHKCTRPGPFSTICHGDCWNNNILYKHKGSKPVDVIFIDYQLTRYASPVTDIAYFLYMSTDRDFLSKHYGHILDIYYGTLTAVLRHCNLDVDKVYPRNIFQKHLKEYTVLGLIEALVSMMIITAPYEDALKMTQMKYEDCGEEVCKDDCHCQNNSVFSERVNGIVDDFFERNYSLDALLNY